LEVYGEDGADVAPEIIVPPRDQTVIRGTTLSELHCITNARPLHALEILWFKDGRPIDEVGVPFSFNDLWNRTLSLFQADFKHEGVYTCQARMTTGGPKLTKDATIIVTEKPHFKTHMPVATLGEFGKAITVPCDVHGVFEPNITWYRNGIPLAETPNLRFEVIRKLADPRGPINALHINFLRQEDSGMFQCSAENEAGDIVGYTWLRVKSECSQFFFLN
jgi:protein sidekick